MEKIFQRVYKNLQFAFYKRCHLIEGFGQFGGVFAARLSQHGASAAATANSKTSKVR